MTDRMKDFLTDLQILLERYDANICDAENWIVIFEINASNANSEEISLKTYSSGINSENIFNRIEE